MNSRASAPSLSQLMRLASLPLRSARSASSASAGLSSIKSMSTFSNCSTCAPFGQRKIECRSRVHLALGPDPAAMARDDALHDGKSHSGAGEFLLAVQALEHAEQLAVVLHVEPGAVVLDAVDALRAVFAAAHLDGRLLALAAELDRVRKKIRQRLPDQRRVAVRRRHR